MAALTDLPVHRMPPPQERWIMSAFPEVEKIRYEGPESDNPLDFGGGVHHGIDAGPPLPVFIYPLGLSEVDPSRQFPKHQEIESLHNLGTERGCPCECVIETGRP